MPSLIFGGARSGKSAYAESLAAKSGRAVVYVATAKIQDEEMQQRIAHHRARRSANWTTVEEAYNLGDVLRTHSHADNVILIDCLTVWLSNLLFSSGEEYPEIGTITAPTQFVEQRADLLAALAQVPGEVILVANEVGMGIVPMGAVSRWFVDEAGRLNQALAQVCERVVWVAAGLPQTLKGNRE